MGRAAHVAARNAAVAAADHWTDPDDGIRYPAGEVHGWLQGHNETVCGLSLSRSQLIRFPHVSWADVQPESGRHAEGVQVVCRRLRPWRSSAAAGRLSLKGSFKGRCRRRRPRRPRVASREITVEVDDTTSFAGRCQGRREVWRPRQVVAATR